MMVGRIDKIGQNGKMAGGMCQTGARRLEMGQCALFTAWVETTSEFKFNMVTSE